MLQGDAPITSWNGVGQVCAGRALATWQQGTCPAGRNTNTGRNPGTLYGAFVTRRALCTCCLISSSQQPRGHPVLVPHFPGEKTEEGMAKEPAQGH